MTKTASYDKGNFRSTKRPKVDQNGDIMAFAENMFFVHLSPLNNTLNDRSMSASH